MCLVVITGKHFQEAAFIIQNGIEKKNRTVFGKQGHAFHLIIINRVTMQLA
ncbi:hypothetical protein SDC9_100408 [bioreactor metagenome]|uniref:Uncharacterized protein n=1 Tax=bioreactor metagenome TaxID=1076179 RepID=A0A645AKG2_9ZZZZ